jgi:hypothetical protein
MQLEGLGKLKKSTSSGLEPATFQNLPLCPAGNIQRFCSVISITGHLGLNSGNNKGDCDDSNDNDDMVLMKKTLMLLVRAPHQSG